LIEGLRVSINIITIRSESGNKGKGNSRPTALLCFPRYAERTGLGLVVEARVVVEEEMDEDGGIV
jgi:hypothetical protein